MFTYFFIYLPVFNIHTAIWERDAMYSRVLKSILPFFKLIKSLTSLLWKWFECLYLLKSMIPWLCRETVSFYYWLVATVDFVNLKQIRCEGYLLLDRLNTFWKPVWFFQIALFCCWMVLTKMLLVSWFFFFNPRNYIILFSQRCPLFKNSWIYLLCPTRSKDIRDNFYSYLIRHSMFSINTEP